MSVEGVRDEVRLSERAKNRKIDKHFFVSRSEALKFYPPYCHPLSLSLAFSHTSRKISIVPPDKERTMMYKLR